MEVPAAQPPREPLLGVCVGLVLLVALLYGQVGAFKFVSWDDNQYVYENATIQHGLTRDGFQLAFSGRHGGLWHPLTTFVHMLNCAVFGLWPGGHHLVSVAIHAANVVLLLIALRRMTGAFWPSVAVAAMFAVHPLNVESVAWISGLKDVLSGLFFMLTLLAYERYARAPGLARYGLVLGCFALGLLAKPILVTVPCVLLLLDIWPLRRWRGVEAAEGTSPRTQYPSRRFAWLAAEKVPLLMASAIDAAMTIGAQQQAKAVFSVADLPLLPRIVNGLISYVAYLGKFIWPARLAFFYPHRTLFTPGLTQIEVLRSLENAALFSAMLLAALTTASLLVIRRRPYLAVGWLWYLGMLVPVIGLMQVGAPAMADRYAYLSLLGIFIAVVWTVRDLAADSPGFRRFVPLAATLLLIAWFAVSWQQIGTWRDSRSLYTHAVEVTENNFVAHDQLGLLDAHRNAWGEAEKHFNEVIRVRPLETSAHLDLGAVYLHEGQPRSAAEQYLIALQLEPLSPDAIVGLGLVMESQHDLEAAEARYRQALRIDPNHAAAHLNLGSVLATEHRLDEAIAQFEAALRCRNDYAEARNNLGSVLVTQGHWSAAKDQFVAALRIDPHYAKAKANLQLVEEHLRKSGPAAKDR